MINLVAMQEQRIEIQKANEAFEQYMFEKKAEVISLFKSLIHKDYQSSLFLSVTNTLIDDKSIKIYAVIPSPIPTEQDDGITYTFDVSNVDSISSKEDLLNCLTDSEKAYLEC